MFFSRIFGRSLAEPRYIRRMRAYLQEARMAMLEHSIAAEYYQSSAEMYAERAARLEDELMAWERGEQHVPEFMHRRAVHGAVAPKPVAMEPAPSPSGGSVGMVRAA
ncbi:MULTISPECIES: hypothetical protein [unclassified Comamonas]|uniref:hypothetical protein n=1 Tax=unclassified Comamonas TaxID=2638500 RepID=UPI000EB1F328|nr:hypothetical protein [Comamonas sp. lk]